MKIKVDTCIDPLNMNAEFYMSINGDSKSTYKVYLSNAKNDFCLNFKVRKEIKLQILEQYIFQTLLIKLRQILITCELSLSILRHV